MRCPLIPADFEATLDDLRFAGAVRDADELAAVCALLMPTIEEDKEWVSSPVLTSQWSR
jgi:hypothetical protein